MTSTDFIHPSTSLRTSRKDTEKTLELASPNIEYKKINPSKYEINIESKTAEPKLIILLENFHSDWRLKIADKDYSPSRANTYANAYLIPGDASGDGLIEFKGQKQYRILQIICLAIFGVLLIYLILNYFRILSSPKLKK